MVIQFIPYHKIDRKKWDDCMQKSMHATIYVTSIYLDGIAGKWHALVAGDYEFVMPLLFKKKLGIGYLYQPAFLPYTGIYSHNEITTEVTESFLNKAFNLYKFAEIAFSFPLDVHVFKKSMKVKSCNNFILDLRPKYQQLYKNYQPNFTKSLRRLQKLFLQYELNNKIKEIIKLYKSLYLHKIENVKPAHLHSFSAMCTLLQQEDKTIIRSVKDTVGNVLAAVILLKYKNKLYNIISCITSEGKKAEANYFLYDKIIEEFSGKDLILDLEGSDINGVANFYLKMNPVNEQYCFIKYNNLPKPIKFFKK